MPKFVKIPVEIEAKQWTLSPGDAFKCDEWPMVKFDHGTGQCYLETIHAGQRVNLEKGDWILPEPDGVHFYPCKPDIFAATYRPSAPIIATAAAFPEGMESALEEMLVSGKDGGLRRITVETMISDVQEVDPHTHPRGEPVDTSDIAETSEEWFRGATFVPPAMHPAQLDHFRNQLQHTINRTSRENGSNTPDFILAEALAGVAEIFDYLINRRDQWYGKTGGPPVVTFTQRIRQLEEQIRAEGAHTSAAQARIEELEATLRDTLRNAVGGS